MKKLLIVALLLNAVLISARFWREYQIAHGGAPQPATDNGDVNVSGQVDIADAQYLLNFLFLGGPAPKPLVDPPELLAQIAELEKELATTEATLSQTESDLSTCQNDLTNTQADLTAAGTELESCQAAKEACCEGPTTAPISATGQTRCYSATGAIVDCNDPTCYGQDGLYQKGTPLPDRFIDNEDGTVTDTKTGLMWQQNLSSTTYTWCNALAHCENLDLADYDDWRLPNVKELQSITLQGLFRPALDSVFTGTIGDIHWSSTTVETIKSAAWVVHLGFGDTLFANKPTNSHRCPVLAVRGP